MFVGRSGMGYAHPPALRCEGQNALSQKYAFRSLSIAVLCPGAVRLQLAHSGTPLFSCVGRSSGRIQTFRNLIGLPCPCNTSGSFAGCGVQGTI